MSKLATIILDQSPITKIKSNETALKIDREFINVINEGPKYYSDEYSNAYVFGNRHFMEEYKFIDEIKCNNKHIFIFDITKITQLELKNINNNIDIDKILPRLTVDYMYDSKNNPFNCERILFMGIINSKNTSVKLYIHLNNDEIDGILIDNNYFT
jgi:hypothetical protein